MAQQGQIRVLEAGLAKHNTDQFNDKNRWQTGKHVPVAATMRGKSAAISGALVVWYCRWLPQKVVHEKLAWLMCFASRKGIRIPESWALESGLQLKESGIPLTIRIQNPSSTDKETESSTWNPESKAWNPESKTVLDSVTWGNVFVEVRSLF